MGRKNNKAVIVILILIALLVIVYASDLGGIKTKIQQGDKYCEENIIPSNFTFHDEQIISGIDEEALASGIIYLKEPVWKDGTKFTEPPAGTPNPYNCHSGKSEGENVNYLYCNGVGYQKEIKDIDAKGNVLKVEQRNYIVDLVIDMENPLGERDLTRIDSYGFERNKEKLTFNRVVSYKCMRVN